METASTIWGIHAGRMGDAESLFQQGYIGLGWDLMGDLSTIPLDQESFKERVSIAYPDFKAGAIPVAAGQMRKFVHVAAVGDLVVYRSSATSTIKIGKIASPYRYAPNVNGAYPHIREVQWLKETKPAQITQGALYELGAAMSFFLLKSYADEWIAVLTASDPPSTVSHSEDSDPTVALVASQIEESTRDFVLKQLEQELKGHPFARFVANLLATMGYRTRVSPEGADGGIDIVAHRDELGFEPPVVKVQVKSGAGSVGQPTVSELLGALSPGEFGLMVTLAGFTAPARSFAKNKSHLRLVDGTDLVELILLHYEDLDSQYKGILPLKKVFVPQPIEN